MTHWADEYVGRPAEGARPCWALVRRVWIDRLGFVMPSFDEHDKEQAVRLGAEAFTSVPLGQEQELDAVMMVVPVRDRAGQTGFRHAETHIGVVVAPGLILHVEHGKRAVVEAIRDQKVSRVLRGPWAKVVA